MSDHFAQKPGQHAQLQTCFLYSDTLLSYILLKLTVLEAIAVP